MVFRYNKRVYTFGLIDDYAVYSLIFKLGTRIKELYLEIGCDYPMDR